MGVIAAGAVVCFFWKGLSSENGEEGLLYLVILGLILLVAVPLSLFFLFFFLISPGDPPP
jgi:hypothetical protein